MSVPSLHSHLAKAHLSEAVSACRYDNSNINTRSQVSQLIVVARYLLGLIKSCFCEHADVILVDLAKLGNKQASMPPSLHCLTEKRKEKKRLCLLASV